jgi:hypothetical protein
MQTESKLHVLARGLATAAILCSFAGVISTLAVGSVNYKHAKEEIHMRCAMDTTFGSDADIENTLRKYGFDISHNEDPNMIDIAMSGIKKF